MSDDAELDPKMDYQCACGTLMHAATPTPYHSAISFCSSCLLPFLAVSDGKGGHHPPRALTEQDVATMPEYARKDLARLKIEKLTAKAVAVGVNRLGGAERYLDVIGGQALSMGLDYSNPEVAVLVDVALQGLDAGAQDALVQDIIVQASGIHFYAAPSPQPSPPAAHNPRERVRGHGHRKHTARHPRRRLH